MGRELKRKQEKKDKKNNIKRVEEYNTDIKLSTFIKLVLSIVLILFVLYYVTALFITEELVINFGNDKSPSVEEAEGVENKILARNTFSQKEGSYYVYFYDFDEANPSIENALSKKEFTMYRVDAGNALNMKYITDGESNLNITSINDLKVKSPTIIMVLAGQVAAYYEGTEDILKFLS